MGLGNWLLKNGPGSPGSTAKHITELYLRNVNSADSPELVLIWIYEQRKDLAITLGHPGNQFKKFNPLAIIKFCKEDLALFTFIILYIETSNFRNGLNNGMKIFVDTLVVIKEVIQKIDRRLITLDMENYKKKAVEFAYQIFDNSETINSYLETKRVDQYEVKIQNVEEDDLPEWLILPSYELLSKLDGKSIKDAFLSGILTTIGTKKGEFICEYFHAGHLYYFAIINNYAFGINQNLGEKFIGKNPKLDPQKLIFYHNNMIWLDYLDTPYDKYSTNCFIYPIKELRLHYPEEFTSDYSDDDLPF